MATQNNMNFTAGTTGQVLTANSSTPATFQNLIMQSASVTLSSAQVKALTTTPITVVPAAGAGTVLLIVNYISKLIYGGTNAFTGGGNLDLRYNNSSGQKANYGEVAAGINSTSNQTSSSISINFSDIVYSSLENLPLVVCNTSTAWGGNAANNNQVVLLVYYFTIKI